MLLKKSPYFFQVSSSALALPLQSLLKFLRLIQTRPQRRSRPRRAECREVESTGSLFLTGESSFFFFFFFAEHRLHDVSDMLFDLAEAQSVWFFPSKERSKNLFTPAFNLSKSIF